MIVFDASTLILLARIGLLPEVVKNAEAVISDVVQMEATRKGTPDAGLIDQLVREKRLRVERVPAKKEVKRLMADFPIQNGEALSVVLARQKGAILATDDKATIKVCKVFRIGFATALHFLVHSRKRGFLSREIALAKLDKLQKYGRYHADIIRDATERIKGGD